MDAVNLGPLPSDFCFWKTRNETKAASVESKTAAAGVGVGVACHGMSFLQCFSNVSPPRIPNYSRAGLKKIREKPWEKPMEPMGHPHRGNMDMTGKLPRMQAKACWAGRFWEGPCFSEMFGQDQPELLNVS